MESTTTPSTTGKWIVETGVHGAMRITTREFDTEGEAQEFARRVRATNSIGSYWAEVKAPAPAAPPTLYEITVLGTGTVLSYVEATTPLLALDYYAVAEGFVPYTDLMADPEHASMVYPEDDEGARGAVFTNYSILASPVTNPEREHVAHAAYLATYRGPWGIKASEEDAVLSVLTRVYGWEGGHEAARRAPGWEAVVNTVYNEQQDGQDDAVVVERILAALDGWLTLPTETLTLPAKVPTADRLHHAVTCAEDAFWAAIAAAYPECKYGDLDPTTTSSFARACLAAAEDWVAANTPSV